VVSVNPVDREENQDDKVRDDDGQIECVRLIDALEWVFLESLAKELDSKIGYSQHVVDQQIFYPVSWFVFSSRRKNLPAPEQRRWSPAAINSALTAIDF
jgi:hypothetical protein